MATTAAVMVVATAGDMAATGDMAGTAAETTTSEYVKSGARDIWVAPTSRRGNPYNNGKAASFMKTIKCE
jgi:hypothetical protein